MQYKELIDKRVVIVASVVMLFMLTMLLAFYPQKKSTPSNNNNNSDNSSSSKEVLYAFGASSAKFSESETGIDVLLKAPSDQKVSAATVAVKYPKDRLEVVETYDPSEDCINKNNKLDTVLAYKNNKETGVLEITRSALLEDEQLPSGEFCFGTLYFKTKDGASASAGEITFDIKSNDAAVVGPKVKYNAKVDASSAKVQVQ